MDAVKEVRVKAVELTQEWFLGLNRVGGWVPSTTQFNERLSSVYNFLQTAEEFKVD